MSFKTAAAGIRSNIASGNYKKKTDPFEGFFEEVSYGLKKRDEEKRLEEIAIRKENRIIARENEKAQKTADLLEQKIEANAKRLALEFAGADAGSNAEIISYFKNDLKASDNDYNGLRTATAELMNSNRLSFPVTDMGTETVSVDGGFDQRPAKRVDRIGPFVSTSFDRTLGKYVEGGVQRPLSAKDLKRFAEYEGKDPKKIKAAAEAQQMLDSGLYASQLEMTTEEVPVTSSSQKVDLKPYTKPFYDTGDLRENNWQGELQKVIANQGEDSDDARAIRAWAVGQKFYTVVGNYTQKELLGMPVDSKGEQTSLNTILNAVAKTDEEKTLVKSVIAVKKAEVEDAKIFNNVEKLLLKPLSDLQMYSVIYEKGTTFGDNIQLALGIKQAQENSTSFATLSKTLDKDADFYEQAIKAQGKLDPDDPFYQQNLQSMSDLLLLKSLAVERANVDDLQAELKLPAKERFLKAKYAENGFLTVGADNKVTVPDSAAMAAIEKEWKELTDITDKPPKWFNDQENLVKMSSENLKAIIDTGLLSEKPEALSLVQGIYNSKIDQVAATKLSQDLDPLQQNFKSTRDLDAHLAALGPNKLTKQEDLDSFARVRSVLAASEGKIAEGEDINAYQVALKTHLALPENANKTGQELINVLTKWETTWKDSTAKTADYPVRTYYLNGDTLEIRSEADQKDAEEKGWSGIKLGNVSQVMSDMGFEDTPENRKLASQIVNKTIKISTTFSGMPMIVDLTDRTGQVIETGLDAAPSLDAALSRSDPNWKKNGLTFVGLDGEQITITPEMIRSNDDFRVAASSLAGLEDAFGLEGAFKKVIGTAADALGGGAYPEANAAIRFMDNLRLNTLINIAAASSTKDSVWNKQQILRTLPEAGKVLTGPNKARDQVGLTLNQIKISLQKLNQAESAGTITKAALSKATITRAALQELERTYTTVLEYMGGANPKNKPSVSSYIIKN